MRPKMIALSATLLCLSYFMNAQTIEKGSTLLGGGLGFYLQKYSQNDKRKVAHISLSSAIAIKDNSFVGMSIGFGHDNSKSSSSNMAEVVSSSYSAFLFYRKYYELGKKFYFFAQPSAGISFGESRDKTTSEDHYSKSRYIGADLAPGFSYKLFESFYMDINIPGFVSIGYAKSNGIGGKSESFQFNSSLSGGSIQNIGVGFNFIF